MQVEKAAVFFDKIFKIMFAVFFRKKMEFWYIVGSFQRGSITVGRMDIN